MVTFLDYIVTELKARYQTESEPMPTVRGVYTLGMLFQPDASDPPFRDQAVLVASTGSGYAAFQGERNLLLHGDLIGRDLMQLQAEAPLPLRVALLDAAWQGGGGAPDSRRVSLSGDLAEKAHWRARIVHAELLRIIGGSESGRPNREIRIHLVGAVASILRQITMVSRQVSATDLDPALVGREVEGVRILDGKDHTLAKVAECDVAIVTAMTLCNDTFDDIIKIANNSHTDVIVIAQTGATLADLMLDYGATSVVAERFPATVFPGTTVIEILRRVHGRG